MPNLAESLNQTAEKALKDKAVLDYRKHQKEAEEEKRKTKIWTAQEFKKITQGNWRERAENFARAGKKAMKIAYYEHNYPYALFMSLKKYFTKLGFQVKEESGSFQYDSSCDPTYTYWLEIHWGKK